MKNVDKYSYMPGNCSGGDDDKKPDDQAQDWWKLFF
ncbi:hypothetical protein PSOS111911_04855 [Pseudoalteromonas ostreae]